MDYIKLNYNKLNYNKLDYKNLVLTLLITAFVLSMARNVAVDFKHPVAIFSLEMSSIQLVNRLISGEAEIPAEDIRRGNFSKNEFERWLQ